MNPVKEQLYKGDVSFGTWIQFGHPGVAEILSNAGFDWIAADMEHSDIGIGDFTNLCRGMKGRNATPLVRVRENDVLAIRQTLDMGAEGIIVPLVNTRDDAARAVAAAKYPPEGIRGYAFHRNNDYGITFTEYAREANNNVLVIVMIESSQAVENIDSILSIPGVDGIFIGPYDMSGSYGIPGKTDAPEMKNAFLRCIDACRTHNKSAGLHLVDASRKSIEDAIRSGFTFIGLGMDNVFIDTGARNALNTARLAEGEIKKLTHAEG